MTRRNSALCQRRAVRPRRHACRHRARPRRRRQQDARRPRARAACPCEKLRPLGRPGARGLIGGAFGIGPEDHEFARCARSSSPTTKRICASRRRCFPASPRSRWARRARHALGHRHQQGRRASPRRWSSCSGWQQRAGCVVCGDTTPHSKPHPAPLLHAARRLGVAAGRCVYVGDDLRDVQAGARRHGDRRRGVRLLRHRSAAGSGTRSISSDSPQQLGHLLARAS